MNYEDVKYARRRSFFKQNSDCEKFRYHYGIGGKGEVVRDVKVQVTLVKIKLEIKVRVGFIRGLMEFRVSLEGG